MERHHPNSAAIKCAPWLAFAGIADYGRALHDTKPDGLPG
jgi:hypothetical protein